MFTESLPAELERRAVELARTTGAKLPEARNVLRDGLNLLGLEKTIELVDKNGLNILALAVCLHPAPVPEKFLAKK